MLPSFLSSSYRQYKTDSDVVAPWLAVTGQQHGYPPDSLLPPTASKSKRPKGKARKNARRVAEPKQADDGAALNTNVHYKIAIRDFVPLAEWIAKNANVG